MIFGIRASEIRRKAWKWVGHALRVQSAHLKNISTSGLLCKKRRTGCERKLCRGYEMPLRPPRDIALMIVVFLSQYDHHRVTALANRLINGITSQIDHVVRNGDPNGYAGCVNLSFAYVEGESLLMALKDIALSSGSACTSASLEPSYVLRALGAAEDMAHSSLRFGIGRFTTEAEIDLVVERIVGTVNKLREMSPLWEMVQEGIDISTIQWSQH